MIDILFLIVSGKSRELIKFTNQNINKLVILLQANY